MNLTAETALHNGKYILNTQLGKGVFSVTYRATHTELGQTVVIKTLAANLRQHTNFDQFKQQFLELSDRLQRCKHPNLVQVLDCFEDAGRPYLVMEYIPGQTLGELIQTHGLKEAKALKYTCQIGNALSVLHKAGLLHQDVKPQNIIRRQDTDDVVLCEFGITCDLTPGAMQTHASLFSSGYAPLEQYLLEEQRTSATDIYALAATLYCLLYTSPPLPAPVRQALHTQGNAHLFPSTASSRTAKLTPVTKQLLRCGLELAPQKRPQSVKDWLSLLKHQKKKPKSKPAPTQHSGTKAKAQAPVLTPLTTATVAFKTPPLTPENNPTSPPAVAQPLATNLKIEEEQKSNALITLKPRKARLPLQALLMTGAIAASVGIGFGFALRLHGANAPGSTLLHTKQSFPPSRHWPLTEPQVQPRL